MKFLSFSQTKLGSSLSLPACLCVNARRQAHGWVGTRATSFFLGGVFCRAKYEIRRRRKNRNRKARAGKNSFPPTPFLFARPSVQLLPREARQSVRVLFKKGSSFVQQLRPSKAFLKKQEVTMIYNMFAGIV